MANRLFKDMNLDELFVERQMWHERSASSTDQLEVMAAREFRDACDAWIRRQSRSPQRDLARALQLETVDA